jgi:hypothetical protein
MTGLRTTSAAPNARLVHHAPLAHGRARQIEVVTGVRLFFLLVLCSLGLSSSSACKRMHQVILTLYCVVCRRVRRLAAKSVEC